jgi:hypothetical protein
LFFDIVWPCMVSFVFLGDCAIDGRRWKVLSSISWGALSPVGPMSPWTQWTQWLQQADFAQ